MESLKKLLLLKRLFGLKRANDCLFFFCTARLESLMKYKRLFGKR